MKRTWIVGSVLIVATRFPAAAVAQGPVPVRELTPPVRAEREFGSILNVREIANGKVLVNDPIRRQLTLLDEKLTTRRVVLDSITVGGVAYGPVGSALIPYLGDSSLFVDRQAFSFQVIDGNGVVSRAAATSLNASDFRFLYSGVSLFDPFGNLLFRATPPNARQDSVDARSGDRIVTLASADSAPVIRVNLASKALDTVGFVRQRKGLRTVNTLGASGARSVKAFILPLETIDEWAVLNDGTVGFVRGHDYHVDFVRPNGRRETGPKMPIDWQRISEADKQRLSDSTRAAMEVVIQSAKARGGSASALEALRSALLAPIRDVPGAAPNAPPTPPIDRRRDEGQPFPFDIVPLSEIPDFHPPVRQGAAKGDAEGNLWILPATSAQSTRGELVYDVVNGSGTLVERVRVPVGRSIVGFGRGGTVYLMSPDAGGWWRLERSSVQRPKEPR